MLWDFRKAMCLPSAARRESIGIARLPFARPKPRPSQCDSVLFQFACYEGNYCGVKIRAGYADMEESLHGGVRGLENSQLPSLSLPIAETVINDSKIIESANLYQPSRNSWGRGDFK